MPRLSIIIPAFEEERKITRDVLEASAFLLSLGTGGEVIVSDDGSTDRTVQVARGITPPAGIAYAVIASNRHRGKGAAVRNGILASHGDYAMFADSGMTVPYSNALRGLRLLQVEGCDLAHGSRELPNSIIVRDKRRDRKILSSLFRTVATRWLHLPDDLTDTQCGFKLYRGEVARRLYTSCKTDGFLFDVEIILRALAGGLRICEFPVEWSCDRDSRLGLRRNAVEILKDLGRLRKLAVRQESRPRT